MYTTSLAFPNIFNISNNTLSILEDNLSIVNRSRLLLLTDPTEMYNELDFGVGLRKFIWQYNSDNVRAMIQDRIKEQLQLHEPYVNAQDTQFADGLLFTGTDDANINAQNFNKLKMTAALTTTYGGVVNVTLNDSTPYTNRSEVNL